MNKPKLTKDGLKGFSISFNKAQKLGITDDDLDGIYELETDKFRISKRYMGERPTKIVYGLTNAINTKWELLNEIKKRKQNLSQNNKEINAYLNLTVKEGFQKLFEYRQMLVSKGELRNNTYEKNVIVYNGKFISNCKLLDKKIVDVTEQDAKDYVDGLFKAVKIDNGEHYSENTLNNPYALMHLAFEYFKKTLKIISSNPFDNDTRKPKFKPKKRDYLATEDIQLVLNEVEKKNIRFRTLVNLSLETGMRIEELTALKFSDINRRRNTISIGRSVTKSRLTNKLSVNNTVKTDSSIREITISDTTLQLIDNCRQFREQLGRKVTNDDYIFTSCKDNDLIAPNNYTREWNEFIEKLGYINDDLPLRIARHSAATFMLKGETNIKAVKRRFGWSKNSTVMDVYEQSNLDDDKLLLNKFDEQFRNNLGVSYAELYKFCMNRLNNNRKTKTIMQKILNKTIDDNSYSENLQICKNYLFEIFPIFSKISKIDNQLDDEEVDALLIGFKSIYKKTKIEIIDSK